MIFLPNTKTFQGLFRGEIRVTLSLLILYALAVLAITSLMFFVFDGERRSQSGEQMELIPASEQAPTKLEVRQPK